MLLKTELPRIFIHREQNEDVRLTDPGNDFSPEAVLNFYSATYPILTTARIDGPDIKGDEVIYKFISVIGTKG
jgi:PRTRC genetic system protein C